MIDWKPIQTVMFDMDGTLLDLRFDNFFWCELIPELYAEQHNMERAEAFEFLEKRFERDKGTLNWYCVDYWSEQLELDIPEIKRQLKHQVSERPHVREFLAFLKTQDITCLLVTNAHPMVLSMKLEQTGIGPLMDGVYTSHTYQHPKEAQQFWQRLAKDVDFQLENTVFFDDSYGVLKAARQFGIQHVIGIAAPDSGKEPTNFPGFEHIHHFDELFDVS